MAQFTVKKFGGSAPRVAPHLLNESMAARALDCKFWHGTLESWREPALVHQSDPLTRTIYQHGCCWLEFGTCVDIAWGSVNCQQLFTTGHQPWPAVMRFEDCVPSITRLGVPCADTAPSVFATAVPHTKDVEGRSYAYQYVNAFAERGSLSKGSVSQLIEDGQSVVVSGWDVPDASWGVTQVRIYRAVSGFQKGNEPGNVLDTTWMLVGEVPVTQTSFTDTLYNDSLIEAVEEDIATPPPENLRGLVYIESMNCLAGFVGNVVHFTENNSYHQWNYSLTLDDNVCALAENNGVIYAATDGAPYAISGAVDCKNAGCRQAVRLPGSYPMVGCGNRRMTSVPQGVVYPSHNGLVALSQNSAPTLITHPLYAPDDWHKLYPESVKPIHFNGRLFVFARGAAFVMTLNNGSEQGWQLESHSELSDTDVIDAYVSRQGQFYLLKATGVYEWDRGDTLRPHHWQSPELVSPVPINFGAAHLYHADGAEAVKITVNGRVLIDRQVLRNKAFRLPMWGTGTRWQIELSGTATVSLISIATAMHELGA